jgi:molybdopterin synthase catalytic subunit
MTYEEATELASRDEAFMATIYAMNTLLISKGIYTKQEYRQLFTEWVEKEERKKARESEAATPRRNRAQVAI